MIEAFNSNRTNIYTYDSFCVTKNKYSMFNVQDNIVLYNYVVLTIIYEAWHFTQMWKSLT